MCEERRLHPHDDSKQDPPTDTWRRIDFPDDKPRAGKDLDYRAYGELEIDRDVVKPVQQIASDFHEQVVRLREEERGNIDVPLLTLEAQARMISMMAKVSLQNQHIQNRLNAYAKETKDYTRQVKCLTIVMVVVGAISAVATICDSLTINNAIASFVQFLRSLH